MGIVVGILDIIIIIILIKCIIEDVKDSYKYWGKLYIHEIPIFIIIVLIIFFILSVIMIIKDFNSIVQFTLK